MYLRLLFLSIFQEIFVEKFIIYAYWFIFISIHTVYLMFKHQPQLEIMRRIIDISSHNMRKYPLFLINSHEL